MALTLALLLLAGGTGAIQPGTAGADAQAHPPAAGMALKAADAYEEALKAWKTPEDIRAWIAANFSYDTDRAMRLSETQRARHGEERIHSPAEFFAAKTGVCVDLARFGVETLKRIDPPSDPKYLMIEFAPSRLAGDTLRRHWLVVFKRGGRKFFFADTQRPGLIAGPYEATRDFIRDYEQYRERQIAAYREADSYQKQRRTQAAKRPASGSTVPAAP
jgi:hypothetical protein